MQYGLKHESAAIAALEKILKIKIEKCRLFIDSEHSFLACTPDDIINEGGGIVEVKTSLQAKDLMVEEAIIQCKSLKTIFVHKNGEYQLSTRHHYYYQVQGQLHITQRKYCIFALWTPKSVINVRVEKDDAFWKNKMEEKLVWFYNDCILSELLDPRHSKKMEIRDPDCIIQVKIQKMES